VANTVPGKRIPVELLRNGQRVTVQAVVGKRPTEEELANQSFDPDAQQDSESFAAKPQTGPSVLQSSLGIVAIPLTPQIARQLGAGEDAKGVVITAVDASADAATKGLQRGDIVLSANYVAVTSLADLEKIVRTAKTEGREAVLLRIQRRGQPATYMPVRLR
jgi:serine protease Do